MEQELKEELSLLRERVAELLDSFPAVEPGSELNPADAFFAYRLLLGRNPAVSELPGILLNRQTLREFLTSLLNSDEFAKTVGFLPPNHLLMSELEGFRFWFNSGDREMGVAMAFSLYEPGSVELIKKIVRPGMRCLDVGAQTGFYTCLMASLVGETGKIHAFEPMTSSYNLLRKNVEENGFGGRVDLYPLAASNVNALIEVSKTSNMCIVGQVEGSVRVNIESVRIDDVIKEPIDVIKIDIEGHEPAAIEGMRNLITRHRPVIISEANEYWLRTCSGSSARDYMKMLDSMGYLVFDVEELEHRIESDSVEFDILDKKDIVAIHSNGSLDQMAFS